MTIKYLNRNNTGQANPAGPGSWTTGFNYALNNYAISYGNGYFVATGDGFIARSSNANTWEYKINTSSGVRGVAYGNGLWVAVTGGTGNTGVLYTSSNDGVSWTNLYQPANNYRRGVAYGNSVWVIICESRSSDKRIFTSTDGSTWTARDSDVIYNSFGITNTISFGGGTFVLVCSSGSSGNTTLCFTSSDGINWTERTLPASTSWKSSAYGNGVWVAVGSGHAARSTDNGATWSSISGRSGTGVTYGDGYFVIAGDSPAYSTDGINWTTISSGPPANSNLTNHIAYGNGIFASVKDTSSSNISTSPMSYIYSQVSPIKFINRNNNTTVLAGTQKAIFGYGRANDINLSTTNIVSNTGVVAADTTGVGTGRYALAAAGYGTDKAIFGYGNNGGDVSMTNLVSNTGVVSTDTTGVGTARDQLAAAGYGSDKALFGYGYVSGTGAVSMTNLVSNTGVVASNTTGVGTARYYLSAAGYGSDKAIFGYGVGSQYSSMTNLVSNTGVVSTDTTGVGTVRAYLAAAGYGSDKAIFGYGYSQFVNVTSITNLVSNTGVVSTDTTGVGTARYQLAAAGYGSDKALFGYGSGGGAQSITNLVSNTGVVSTDTTGVGTARPYLAAAGFSTGTIPAPSVMKFTNRFTNAVASIVTSGLVLNLDASNASSYPGSGTSWFDLSGNSNNGTLTNGPTFNSANGGSIVFDGTNDYVDLGNISQLKPTTQITVSAWVYRSTMNDNQDEAIIGCTQSGGYELYYTTNKMKFYVYAGGSYRIPEMSTSAISGWMNFTATYDNRYAKLYYNGVLQNTVDSGATNNISYVANNILIGAEVGAGSTRDPGFEWTGKIAQTLIYNTSLSASEVLQNYNATKAKFGL